MYFLLLLLFGLLATAQFPPLPSDVTYLQSTQHPEVSISYKQTHLCEETAKAWTGYIHMPASYLADVEDPSDPYNISMFFWYFSAREAPQTAPTAMYLAGGPGESSLFGAVLDAGPCYINRDSNSTTHNPFSMNARANVLYVDQPVGAGYSYDMLVKSTQDLMYLGDKPAFTGNTPFDSYNGSVPAQNTTFKYGVLPSSDFKHAPNTTALAARTVWHFSQVWFADFLEWDTCDRRVSLWGNSYGGFWTTAIAAETMKQNVKIRNGEINGTIIDIDSIGSLNGCIDLLYSGEAYVTYAYNNSYNLPLITKTEYEKALYKWNKPGGCKSLIETCRQLQDQFDPLQYGVSAEVNEACVNATAYCAQLFSLNGPSGRDAFDIAHMNPDPDPLNYAAGFFNRQWVQAALGSPVNFTAQSLLINNAMLYLTGDFFARAGMKDVEYLLAAGVKTAFVYGDRDYRCPWVGAEALALSAKWRGQEAFEAAGYQAMRTNSSYNGGVVKQHGLMSFTRVFEAGHDVSNYQPETVVQIFNRVLFNTDVATGTVPTEGGDSNYTSDGPVSCWDIKDELPPPPPVNCYLYTIYATCSKNQYAALGNGTAVIDEGFNVISPVGTFDPVGGTGGGVNLT